MQLPPGSFIASGPVIIENDRVLLNKGKKAYGVSAWMFPGGEVEDFNETLEAACYREAQEEMGIEIELIRPLKPVLLYKDDIVIILIHYLARRLGEIKPGPDIIEWAWHDIRQLPEGCAPNVYQVITNYLKGL